MNHSEATTTRFPESPVSIYDRFTNLYDLMFRINGYGLSLERYLRESRLQLPAGASILDAGCGTGLLTLALLRVLERPSRITAVDLSARSLQTARRAAEKSEDAERHTISFVRANVLELPFPDDSFDFVMTSGVLEYVPLHEGMRELARVLAPGGYLLHLPVRPSPMSTLLEVMFRFKAHPPLEVSEHTQSFFRVIENHHFHPIEPIGWTKTAVLAQKP
ncbi:MAG TPA: methyltransferase domain-containing protein [Pyrinomonadaceae bacterium]|nr:methyltransferase domain-containing protein [Pyrinomonadaceae bacterium]